MNYSTVILVKLITGAALSALSLNTILNVLGLWTKLGWRAVRKAALKASKIWPNLKLEILQDLTDRL